MFLDWTEKNLKSFYTLNHIFYLTDALANFSFFYIYQNNGEPKVRNGSDVSVPKQSRED